MEAQESELQKSLVTKLVKAANNIANNRLKGGADYMVLSITRLRELSKIWNVSEIEAIEILRNNL
jgi:hypothetical protein